MARDENSSASGKFIRIGNRDAANSRQKARQFPTPTRAERWAAFYTLVLTHTIIQAKKFDTRPVIDQTFAELKSVYMASPNESLFNTGVKTELTTLFADVCGSTGIYEQLGDEAGRNLVDACVQKLRGITEQNAGRFIKSNGDDIMCTFPLPQQAVDAACAMQVFMDEFAKNSSSVPISVRIGFQHGVVVHEPGGDVRGDSVNVAARLADYAKAGQIVTSEETVTQTASAGASRRLERVRLKGKTEHVVICEIYWKHDFSMTVFASEFADDDADHLRLVIQLGEQSCFVSEANFRITIGRDPNSDIRVSGKRASRHHAEIEFRRGTFVLKDISTNATYFRQGMEETRLHREQAPIIGSGQLSLGIPFNKSPQEIIELIPKNQAESSRET